MKSKIKTFLESEKGMGIVNVLFVLSMLIRSSSITSAACVAWIIYLKCFRRKTSSKVVRAVNGIFIMFAALMIAVNLYFMIKIFLSN